jgi:hypothetical protein
LEQHPAGSADNQEIVMEFNLAKLNTDLLVQFGYKLTAAGVAGKVEEVQIFTTVMLTPDN